MFTIFYAFFNREVYLKVSVNMMAVEMLQLAALQPKPIQECKASNHFLDICLLQKLQSQSHRLRTEGGVGICNCGDSAHCFRHNVGGSAHVDIVNSVAPHKLRNSARLGIRSAILT